jgi:hypothetical protein
MYEEYKGEEWMESNLGKRIQFITPGIRLVAVLEYLGNDVIAVMVYRNKSYFQKCKIAVFAGKAREDWDMAKAQEQQQRNTSVCSHVYVGKTFKTQSGWFTFNWVVLGFSPETADVTVRDLDDSRRVQEKSCYDVPR